MKKTNGNNNGKHSPRKCTSEAQKYMIRKAYAERAAKQKAEQKTAKPKKEMPTKYPFWARLKIYKNRTTLVIDDSSAYDKQNKKMVDGYVHREATHTKGHGEHISPNPDKTDSDEMYLKSPTKLPKRFFKPHNKDLDMPQFLIDRYDKNNHKDDPNGDGEK